MWIWRGGGIGSGNSQHLQRFHPAQEPAQIQEVGERLPVLFAGHPGLFPLRRVDFRIVPDQGVRRRRPAAPRRTDHRVAHLQRASARDTETSRQCAPLSAQPRLRTLSRSLATSTWSACQPCPLGCEYHNGYTDADGRLMLEDGAELKVVTGLDPENGTTGRFPTRPKAGRRGEHGGAAAVETTCKRAVSSSRGFTRFGSQPKEQSTMTLFRASSRRASS